MKKRDIKIGETYLAKVSGKLVPVRITSESPYGGWNAINTTTGREVRIRSAARLRRPMDNISAPGPLPEADAPAPTPNETAPLPCNEVKFFEFPTALEAVRHAAQNGGKAILMDGRNLVASEPDTQFLAGLGIEFAYLCEHKGRIVTVPVND